MDMNEAVITTKYVLEDRSKVVYVFHSEQGWKFYGNEKDITEEDARVISLGNMLILNPHVEKVLWITEGMEAWMNEESDVWQSGYANSK